ncbi:hypothetical protein EYF80_035868 [Liparis tanakae]|uniref:Uncharacterized protein n=1 Tax=Liparis tanakae TaxID=230148 RepID=A0A4Z2GL00_9TELE|nr:hypothetical protein EYF80_035868 [Liparis tanakae]
MARPLFGQRLELELKLTRAVGGAYSNLQPSQVEVAFAAERSQVQRVAPQDKHGQGLSFCDYLKMFPLFVSVVAFLALNAGSPPSAECDAGS